jgi:hypothetical protein
LKPNLVAITTLPAERRQRLADQLLVGEGAVDLGRVEEGDAAVHRRVEKIDHLLLVGRRIAKAHPHTAQPEGGNFQTALA